MKGLVQYLNWEDKPAYHMNEAEMKKMAEEWLVISDTDKDGNLSVAEATEGIAKWANKELGVKAGTDIYNECFLKLDVKITSRDPPIITVDELLQHMKQS